MPALSSRLLKRIAAGLASGIVFAGMVGVGYWAGSTAKTPRPIARPGEPPAGDEPPSPEVYPGGDSSILGDHPAPASELKASGPADPKPATIPAHEGAGPEDDSALFGVLDRLERRMAAGMIRARDSVVAIEYTSAESPPGSRRIATGVVINAGGDVLSVRIDPPAPARSPGAATGGPAPITAQDASGRRHRTSWVASDPESGLTLLRIAPRAVQPIQIAAEEPTLGSQVFVVGNPFGLGHSVSRGHIAGLDRALKLGSRQLGGLIQVQAPLYPGDSGAVVANLRGHLLGLIRSGLAIPTTPNDRAERDNDFGFALAARDVLWVVDQLRARGRVDRAYLGVRLESAASPAPSGAESQATRDEPPLIEGAVLEEVLAGTPAASAGLKAGDTIVAVDGHPVRSSHDLTDRLDRLPSQAAIRLDVIRGRGPERRRLTVELRTCSRPDSGEQVSRVPAPSSAGQPESPSPAQGRSGQDSAGPSPSAPVALAPTAAPAPPPESGSVPAAAAAANSPAAATPIPPAAPGPSGEQNSDPSIKAQPRADVQRPAAVSIPPPARSPLRAPVPPLQPEELKLTVPRAVADRLEQIEHRLEKLEQQSVPPREPRQASSTRVP